MRALVIKIKRLLRVYRRLIVMSIETEVYNRADFMTRVIFSISNIFVFLIFIDTIFGKYGSMNGWSKDEVILIYGFYTMVIGLMDMFVMDNVSEISDYVYDGQLDKYLSKPINSLLLLSLQKTSIFYLVDIIIGVIFIVLGIRNLGVVINIEQVMLLMLIAVPGFITLYNMALILVSLSFRSGRISHIFYILDNFKKVGNLPFDSHTGIYSTLFKVVFPFVLIAAIPTGVISRSWGIDMILPYYLVAIVWGLLGRVAWRSGISKYVSAGG